MQRVEHDLSNIREPESGPEPPRRGHGKTVAIAIVLSLLLHALLVLIDVALPKAQMAHEHKEPMRAHLVAPRVQKQDDALKKQVVSTAAPKELQRPKEADYLSEYDQSTKEQTKSRVQSPHAPVVSARPSSSVPTPPSPRVATPQPKSRAQERRVSDNGIFAKPQESRAAQQAKLLPTWKDAINAQGMPFNDNLKNVAEDVETRLNTWEWRHATFFNRVKEAVARRWDPNYAIRRHDPTGDMIGKQDRLTQLAVTIDSDGKLVGARVATESGVYYLDDEALRAFRDAAPFANPPKALFASGGTFEFLFGFMVNYDRGLKFDLNWKTY